MHYFTLLLIFASATTSTAQLNRVASRHLLRRRNRHFKGSSKAAKEPTLTSSVSLTAGSKASKPPHSYIIKTKRPTSIPSASPSKADKETSIGGDDVYEVDIIMEPSLSMEMVDSLSFKFL